MRRKLVAGNWKMHGTKASVESLMQGLVTGAKAVAEVELAVFPPALYVDQVARALATSDIAYGGQDLSAESEGAFTGECSATMLADFGCRYVLVGHSERRTLFNESDPYIVRKYLSAKREGIQPILCVGENLAEREQDLTEQVVSRQIEALLAVDQAGTFLENAIIAYEPVWAIGTGKTAEPRQAEAVHAMIRALFAARSQELADDLRILYGGSVKPENAAELFTMPNIDGALVGGASLKAESFLAIAAAAL